MRSAVLHPLLGIALGVAAWPSAADVAVELRRCRQIADAPARVSCYDAIALPVAPATAPTSAGPAPGPAPGSTVGSAAGSAVTAPTRVASAPLAAPTPATATAAAAPSTDPSFGLPAKPPPPAQDAVESTIVGRFDGWIPDGRITLANNQVWQINDGSTAAYSPRQDPKVRITRGTLGSYFLEVEGLSQTPRVKRIR
jgi:hypothetical protein